MSATAVRTDNPASVESQALEPPEDSLSREQYALGFALLIGFAVATCLAGLRGGPVMGDHECIVAQSARQCVQTGDWLIPYLGEIPRIRKTPIAIWLAGLSSYVLDAPGGRPVSAYSARMPSAIAAVLNAAAVCWLGTMLYGRRAGLVAGFIAAGCVGTIVYARNAQVDMTLTMFTTLSFACFWSGALAQRPSRLGMVAFYVAFAAAMMAKAPLPAATVGLPLTLLWFVVLPAVATSDDPRVRSGAMPWSGRFWTELDQQLRRIPRLWFVPGLILFLVLAGTWPIYAFEYVKHALHLDALKLWKNEYADRFSGGLSERSQPPWYYIPMVFGLTAPYLLSLPEAIAGLFTTRYRAYRRQMAYVLTWAIVGTACISAAAYKRPHYLLSMVPAYCLLLAPVIDRLFFGRLWVGARTVLRTSRAIPVLLLVVAVVGGVVVRRELPALMHAYSAVAVALLVVWSAAAHLFGGGRRTLAFAALNLGVLLAVTLGWPAAGAAMDRHPRIEALVAGFERHGVRRTDAVYWVAGRPDAAIEFYSGYRIRRLINELEMAELRSNRRTESEEMYREAEQRIRQRLDEPGPVYLLIAGGHYGLMQRETDIRARVLFELDGFHEKSGDDLLVITQPDVTSTRPSADR